MPVKGRFLPITGLCLLLFNYVPTSSAQSQQWTRVQVLPQRDNDFQRSLDQYIQKDYRAAFVGFETLSSAPELHQRMTASLLMAGKSLFHLEKYVDAVLYFNRLLTTFPQSQYVDDAHFAKALNYHQWGKPADATQDFLWVVDQSSQDALVTPSRKAAVNLMQSDLSTSELRTLLKNAMGEKSTGLIVLELSRRMIEDGSADQAVQVLRAYKQKYPSSELNSSVDELIRAAENPSATAFKVGTILPLTGLFAEEGRGVLSGIRFAQQEAERAGLSLKIEIWDSESKTVNALQGVKRMIGRNDVKVVIGELESGITAGIGALASENAIPVLAPTASENEVTTVGRHIFQLNSNLEAKGQKLAEYAFDVLGMRTFAVLAPADDYGQQMTDSFTSTVDRLGGRIISQQWFYPGTQDLNLRRQFQNIRAAAFAFDSTDVELLVEEAEEKGDKLEEKDIPVLSIDGIFLPIYTEDIAYVAPQFALGNIRAQVLGGEYWDDLEILQGRQVEPYINGIIFVSDFFPDSDNQRFRDFRNNFRLAMKRTPERWEAFGYDALSIVAQAVKSGARTSGQISEYLNSLTGFQGVKGPISFQGNRRVNKEVNFLQFINGRIVKHRQVIN